MSNDLLNQNWSPLLSKDTNIKVDQFIDIIKEIDTDSPTLWTKWKNYSNQVVISTPFYYYKVYQMDLEFGEFQAAIRDKLAQIYRDKFGLHWLCKTIVKDNTIYQIEQREKLEVCNSSNISFDDLMIDWGNTLKELEKLLILPKVCKQLQDKIDNLYELKLIRDCVNKYEDYALTKNGNVVLLDDSDWFIAMVDKDYNWISEKFNAYDILTLVGERKFVPQDYNDTLKKNMLDVKINEPVNKWQILNIIGSDKTSLVNFMNKREQMLHDNIKVLSSGKCLPNKTLYITNV